METKLWISWGVMACITLLAGITGAEKELVYILAFVSAGFGFSAFLIH